MRSFRRTTAGLAGCTPGFVPHPDHPALIPDVSDPDRCPSLWLRLPLQHGAIGGCLAGSLHLGDGAVVLVLRSTMPCMSLS